VLNAAKEPSPFEIDVLEEQFKESFAEELKELTESESGQSQYSHEETPSQVLDDFFLLKQNQTLDLEKEEFQNAEILLQESMQF
jgi:hypothetical protein